MRNLSDISDLYNFQNVAILCEIMENHLEFTAKKLWIQLWNVQFCQYIKWPHRGKQTENYSCLTNKQGTNSAE